MLARRPFHILLTLVSAIVFTTQVQAETIGTVQVLVQDDQSNPIEGLSATLVDSTDFEINFGESNSLGFLNFFDVEEGDYTIRLKPSESFNCSGCGVLVDEEVSFTASLTDQNYDAQTDVQTLTTVSLEMATRFVTVTVTEASNSSQASISAAGDPVEEMLISAWNTSGSSFASGNTDANGQFQFAVDEDDDSLWFISAYPSNGDYSEGFIADLEVETSGETEASIEVFANDATITANFVTQDGTAYTVGQNQFGSVNCHDQDTFQFFFFGNADPGSSSVDIGVVGGKNYQCSLWIEGFGSTSSSVTVASGGTANVNLTLLERDAEVTVRLVDSSGNLVTTLSGAEVYAFADPDPSGTSIGDYANATATNGVATINLISDEPYQVGYFIPTDGGGGGLAVTSTSNGISIANDGTQYLQTYETKSVTPSSSSTQTVEFELLTADATVEVTVLDSDGNPEVNAYVDLFEISDDPNSFGIVVGDITNAQGKVTLSAVGGKTYNVFAFPIDAFSDGVIPPGDQQISLAVDETKSVTLQTIQSDFSLGLSLNVVTSSSILAGEDLDFSYCYAYSPEEGYETFTDSFLGGSQTELEIPLVSGEQWYIGCSGYKNDIFYRSTDQIYTPGSAVSISADDTLTVELEEAGDFYEPQSYTFDGSAATTITLPDGCSTLSIPATAMVNSGNVTLNIGTAEKYNVNENNYAITVFDFDAVDSEGNQITEFSQNLTLSLCYDPARLPDGMNEEDLVGNSYDENSNSWEAPVSVTVNAEENKIEIVLNHFSFYGVTGNRNLDTLATPERLRAKKVKDKSAKLKWAAGTGLTVSGYQIMLKPKGRGKGKKRRIRTRNTKTSKKVKNLTPGTKYRFRVRALGEGNRKGDWSSWKTFRTRAG